MAHCLLIAGLVGALGASGLAPEGDLQLMQTWSSGQPPRSLARDGPRSVRPAVYPPSFPIDLRDEADPRAATTTIVIFSVGEFAVGSGPFAGATVCTRPTADPDPRTKRPWKLLLESDATDAELKVISAEFTNGLQTYPDKGQVPLVFGNMTEDGLRALLNRYPGRVKSVQEDEFVKMVDDPEPNDGQSERRTYPWGIQYVQADAVRGRGVGVSVYVLDTGIRITHNEFGGRAFAGVDLTTPETYPGTLTTCSPTSTTCANDVHGHGSHCAGTVGSSSYGVADGATIWSMKVLNNAGSGWTTWMVMAEQWILASGNRPAVVSSSIQVGPNWNDAPWLASTDALVADGVTVVVAAGNSNQDACTWIR
ncbi:unnamed protein product [Prorocentrum cordatum]|uniref:subtilisin n=1 Tax=Prorocentrum cordatum TaxID=2364126 RepID=A0ABN9TNC6_9DINO|nr:unnamed protein product [Polarella glacialis]